MTKIRLMPDALANQIAAGEVVERPASVVKELVENSLDAGASSIFALIEKSGKDRIRISDDGIGMSPEDARLSLERHATSKLYSADELSNISSLGFRGEALPSIASVSQFTLQTREASSNAGYEIEIVGGKLVREGELGVPPGTVIDVRQLFVNVPARRKFLRADVTEASHIAAQISNLAVCYPDVHFRLEHGKRKVLDTPSVPSRRERIYQIDKSWVETTVVLDDHVGSLAIQAWLAPPAESRGTSTAAARLRERKARQGSHPHPRGHGSLSPGFFEIGDPARLFVPGASARQSRRQRPSGEERGAFRRSAIRPTTPCSLLLRTRCTATGERRTYSLRGREAGSRRRRSNASRLPPYTANRANRANRE